MRNPLRRAAASAAPRPAGFYRGAPYAHCPAEDRTTPHRIDAGRRRCLVCKTTTTKDDE